jgi:hypothetical protein
VKDPLTLFYGGLSYEKDNIFISMKYSFSDAGFNLIPMGSDLNPATGHNEGNDMKIINDGIHLLGSYMYRKENSRTHDFSLDANYDYDLLGGDHEISFGANYHATHSETQSLYSNQRILWIYRIDVPTWNYVEIVPDYYSDVNFNRISFYLNDTATFGRLNAKIGVRYDRESTRGNAITQPAFTWDEPGSPQHGEQISDIFPAVSNSEFKPDAAWSLISPRISFTYDITGDGKNVVRLSGARYMSQMGSIASGYYPGRGGHVPWWDGNGDEVPAYDEMWWSYFHPYGLPYNPETGLYNIQFDPKYNSPYIDEATLMFEKAMTDDLAISLAGFCKRRRRLVFDVDDRGEQNRNSKGIFEDGSIESKVNWEYSRDIMVGGTTVPVYEQIDSPVGIYYYNKEKAYDRYLGIQLSINKRFSNNWMFNWSFTYQDWKRHRFEDETLDLNNFNYFNEGVVAPAAKIYPDIWVNSRWMVKLTGMHQLPWGFNFSYFFQAREGHPYPSGKNELLNQGDTFIYPADQKAGDMRLPTFWMLNLGLEKTINITDTIGTTIVANVYNATNNQIPIQYNPNIGADTPGEPEPIMWTNPGIFQLGVRFRF